MNSYKKNKGFTLIETMICVALFLVVVLVSVDSLLNTTVLHKKSQNLRSIMDSLSFVMEDMSRNLRTGYDYHCINDGIINPASPVAPQDCTDVSNIGSGISFKTTAGVQWVYIVSSTARNIQKSVSNGDPGTFVVLTPPEMKIDTVHSGFIVSNALPPPGNTRQPLVTIRLVGTITSENNIIVPFSLQTSVSQRLVDINTSL